MRWYSTPFFDCTHRLCVRTSTQSGRFESSNFPFSSKVGPATVLLRRMRRSRVRGVAAAEIYATVAPYNRQPITDEGTEDMLRLWACVFPRASKTIFSQFALMDHAAIHPAPTSSLIGLPAWIIFVFISHHNDIRNFILAWTLFYPFLFLKGVTGYPRSPIIGQCP
jgi:hypothetical protein